jgi:hypothetical protein
MQALYKLVARVMNTACAASSASVPLPAMESEMLAWIAAQKARP